MSEPQLIQPGESGFLANGLKYIVQSDRSHPVLCLQLFIKVGSAWEAESEAGYSHFMEHLAFKSTRAFGYNQVMQFVNGLGGSLNAYTDFDCTCFYLLLPSEYLSEGLHVLSELAVHPSFTAEDLAMEKDIISEELKQAENDPENDFLEYIQSACFRSNPLQRPVLGTLRSIRSATPASLKAFHHKYYQPANAFVVIAGDADSATVRDLTERHFGAWQPGQPVSYANHTSYLEPEFPPAPSAWRKNKQEFIAYILPELCDTHPASDALLIAIRHLAIGRSSRLFKRLVEQEKVASSVKVTSYCGVMSGVSAIVVSPVHRDHVDRIHAIFREEYAALLAGSFDPAEFELVKKDIINTWRYGFEGMENLANMIGAEEFIEGFEKLYSYDRQILPLSLDDVLGRIRQYWQPSHLMLIHQAPRPVDLSLSVDRPRRRNRIQQASPPTPIGFEPEGKPLPGCPLAEVSPGYYTCQLPNGIIFHYRHFPERPISGFALATDVSQLSESPAQRGLNYLCSSAMLHSTRAHSYEEIQRLARSHGLSLNVEQHLDTTAFLGKCFHAELPVALSLLAEIAFQPAFEPGHIHLLKTASIDLLRRDRHNPASYGFFRWFELVFGPNSPYGRFSGRISDLRRHSRDSLLAWYQEKYRPERFSLAIVGAEEPPKVLELVSRLFCPQPEIRSMERETPPLPHSLKTRRSLSQKDSGQAIIHLGGFGPPASETRATSAFHLLTQILGGDMDSRLFNLIREKYGYAYQTGFEYTSTRDLGYWFAYAYCDPEDRQPCLKLMREVLAEVCSQGVSATELLHAQNYLCGMNRFELESASLQALLISNLSALGYDPDFYLNREQRIRSVTLDEVSSVARAWLDASNHWTHILL